MVRPDTADLFGAFYDEWHAFAVLVARASVDDDVAQDLAQRIFVRLWRSGEWRGLRSPGHYLRQAVRNEVISWSRRRTLLPLSTLSELELGHPSSGPEERLLLAEARVRLVALFKRLPPRCSQAMTLRYCHGLSNREIAGEMDIGIKMVEKHMARGRRYLEKPGFNAELRAILDTLIAVGGDERRLMRLGLEYATGTVVLLLRAVRWYNPRRRQSALGYLSPAAFEARHHAVLEAPGHILQPGRGGGSRSPRLMSTSRVFTSLN